MASVAPFHPGEFLRDELNARCMSQAELAKRLGWGQSYVSQLVNGRSFTATNALRLEYALGVSAETWLKLQMAWDLHFARSKLPSFMRKRSRRNG